MSLSRQVLIAEQNLKTNILQKLIRFQLVVIRKGLTAEFKYQCCFITIVMVKCTIYVLSLNYYTIDNTILTSTFCFLFSLIIERGCQCICSGYLKYSNIVHTDIYIIRSSLSNIEQISVITHRKRETIRGTLSLLTMTVTVYGVYTIHTIYFDHLFFKTLAGILLVLPIFVNCVATPVRQHCDRHHLPHI